MKRLLWLMLAAQAAAFAVAVAMPPVPPGPATDLQPIGIFIDRFVAALGFSVTVVVALLSVSPDRANRWIEVAVDATAVVIAWLVLGGYPFALTVIFGAVVAATFALIVLSLLTSRQSHDDGRRFDRKTGDDAPSAAEQ